MPQQQENHCHIPTKKLFLKVSDAWNIGRSDQFSKHDPTPNTKFD